MGLRQIQNISEQFEANNGFRLIRDHISVVCMALSFGRKLSEQENAIYSAAIDRYLAGVPQEKTDIDPKSLRVSQIERPLSRKDFSENRTDILYKYVSSDTWDYIRNGSFQ